jgi:ABC-type multidrug transport system ATPase subunit
MHLQLQNLTKSFGRSVILNRINADIREGSLVAVVGDNAAGKTTLLRLLASLYAPDDGSILFDGEELIRQRLDLRRRFFFLADFPEFIRNDALEEISMNVQLWLAVKEGLENRIVDWMERLHLLNLAKNSSITPLSRGQRYKLALISLLAVDPELWLLDEPFASGMDPRGLALFREESWRAVRERRRTLIFSTQMVELACDLSTHVALLQDGNLTLLRTDEDLGRDARELQKRMEAATTAKPA